jgi:hypothetical protein
MSPPTNRNLIPAAPATRRSKRRIRHLLIADSVVTTDMMGVVWLRGEPWMPSPRILEPRSRPLIWRMKWAQDSVPTRSPVMACPGLIAAGGGLLACRKSPPTYGPKPRQDHRRSPARAPSVRFNPLAMSFYVANKVADGLYPIGFIYDGSAYEHLF